MKYLRICDTLNLPAAVATEKLALLGRTGSGKTYAAMKLAELLHDAGAQFVSIDPVGVWWAPRGRPPRADRGQAHRRPHRRPAHLCGRRRVAVRERRGQGALRGGLRRPPVLPEEVGALGDPHLPRGGPGVRASEPPAGRGAHGPRLAAARAPRPELRHRRDVHLAASAGREQEGPEPGR